MDRTVPQRRADADATHPAQSEQDQQLSLTKRRRVGYACDFCRAKKNRCDGERPACGPCRARRHDCVYSPTRTKITVTQEYVDNLRARNRTLEEHLNAQQREKVGTSYVAHSVDADAPSKGVEDYSQIPFSKGSTHSVPHYSADRNVLDDNVDNHRHKSPQQHQSRHAKSPCSATAGAKSPGQTIDRRRSSQLINDNYRHHPSDANHDGSEGSPGEYFGESSAFDFIARVGSPAKNTCTNSTSATTAVPNSSTGADTANLSLPSSSLQPVPSALPKGCSGAERGSMQSHAQGDSLAGSTPSTIIFEEFLGGCGGGEDSFELPQRSLADMLVTQFFNYRHPLSPYLHEGTFRNRYERLWLSRDAGGEAATLSNVVWLGLVNMVFAFGSEHGTWPRSSSDRDRARFFKRAKTLVLSGVLQAGKIELVQALLLMGHYLHASLELNHCWTVVGLAVRTAQELGLYLDPARFTVHIVEQEIRKRVWWGCFVFDRQISSKLGRPPLIHDANTIQVGLPLAVDDEFLDEASAYSQPAGVPSKTEYLRHIVGQCRIVEKVLDTLYSSSARNPRSGGSSSSSSVAGGESDKSYRMRTDLPDLLAESIQLDGVLVAWREGLPRHLCLDSEPPEWHFERQRSVLMMRFLHTRLLIHRQILLFYISCHVSDTFQLDLIRLCIKRCVMAAYESITQMRRLRRRKSLSSFWHNSHYVFAALGVLLVYQKIDSSSRAHMGIPSTLDIDKVIAEGLENLERVGAEIHPLASRYLESFQQLQTRLQTITILSANAPQQQTRAGRTTFRLRSAGVRQDPGNGNSKLSSLAPENDIPMIEEQRQNSTAGQDNYGGGGVAEQMLDQASEYVSDSFVVPCFNNEFELLQSVLLDNGDMSGFMDFDWPPR